MEVYLMFKKITIFVMVAVIFAFGTVAYGNVKQIQKQHPRIERVTKDNYIYSEGTMKHRLHVVHNRSGRAEVIDTLSWYDQINITIPNYYYNPGDTVVQTFKLVPDPARLIKVRGAFGEGGGTADFYVWEGRPGTTIGIPGEALDNRQWNVTGSAVADFEELDFTDNGVDTLELPWSPDPDPANRPFFDIGYIFSGTAGATEPNVWIDYNQTFFYDEINGNFLQPLTHSFMLTTTDDFIHFIAYGSGIDPIAQHVFEVIVKYYNGTSPFINSLTQLPNTWYTSGFNSITSKMMDADGSIANAWLFYQTQNSANPDSVMETSSEGDPGDIITYTFDIAGTFSAGDTITYWTKAVDNEGKSITSSPSSFVIKTPQNPTAEVLVVYENLDITFDKSISIPDFWEPVLDAVIQDSLGMQYEVWDVNDNRGIDRSIIDYSSFKTALAFGFGISNIPAQDWSTSDWKGFVESGKNLMIAAPDYLFDNNLPEQADYTAVPGDFIYDVLGCGVVHNDPEDANENSIGDDILFGLPGDPISDPWSGVNLPLQFNFTVFLDTVNYNDWAENNTMQNAATVFYGVSSGRGNGVRNINEWGGATLFLPFSLSAIADSTAQGRIPLPDAFKLLKQFFDYIPGGTAIDEPGIGAPLSYELQPNYPNPFNPSTTITYSIQKAGLVKLTIYNLLGEKVRTLVNTTQAADEYHIAWDGKNDAGINVASGVYIYKLSAGDFSDSRKMILMK
jgi:hypothetical protein